MTTEQDAWMARHTNNIEQTARAHRSIAVMLQRLDAMPFEDNDTAARYYYDLRYDAYMVSMPLAQLQPQPTDHCMDKRNLRRSQLRALLHELSVALSSDQIADIALYGNEIKAAVEAYRVAQEDHEEAMRQWRRRLGFDRIDGEDDEEVA